MDIDIGIALSTGLGIIAVVASAFSLFQNYSSKKLSLIMETRIKDLESDRSELKIDLKEQRTAFSEAMNRVQNLENEISSLRRIAHELIIKSESLAGMLSNFDSRLANHEEKLLNMAREAAKDVAITTSNKIIKVELTPAIQTIKFVEKSLEQVRRELKEYVSRAKRELEY